MRAPRVAPRRQDPRLASPPDHRPAKAGRQAEGRHLGVAAALMAVCCGVHLLLAAGILAGVGAWFVGHSLAVAAGAAGVAVAAVAGWRTVGRRRRGGSSLRCPVIDPDSSPPERPRM